MGKSHLSEMCRRPTEVFFAVLSWSGRAPCCVKRDRALRFLRPVRHIVCSQLNEIAIAQIAVDGQENRARSRAAWLLWRWIRMAEMSYGVSGSFWPMILPLLHDSRV